MAESAGGKWEIGELSPPHGSSILAGKAGENLERGEDEPARQNQVIVKSEDESSMAEDAGRKRKSGKTARLTPRLGLVQNSIDFLKRGKDKLARLYQRERKSGEEGPARPYLDAVKADSSMDEYAAIEGKRVVDEPARLNQDMIPREADVILSFRGSDNLFGFVNSLYRRLVADGIRVFIDDSTPAVPPEELRLLVSSSKIYVPIFSVNYARSPRCLDSLALMVEHASKSGGKKEILPVFYDVERSDVQLEKESLYRDALDTHKQSSGDEKVEQWKKALVEAGKIKGWEPSSCNSEGELIKSIVGEISLKLKIEHNYAAEDLSTGDNPLLSDWTSVDTFPRGHLSC